MIKIENKCYWFTAEETLKLEDIFPIREDINKGIKFIKVINKLDETYPVSVNILQDDRDKSIIKDICYSLTTSQFCQNIDKNLLFYCGLCLSDKHYNVYTKNSRWHKKGDSNERSRKYDIPGVRIIYSDMCQKCFKRIEPHLTECLQQLSYVGSKYYEFIKSYEAISQSNNV